MEETGVMIAFYPTPEMALALHTALSGGYPDGLANPTDLHMTLAYLGEIAELEAQGVTAERVGEVLRGLGTLLSPVKGQISGIGRFTNTHMEGMDAVVLLVDSPDLPDVRQIITNELTAQGIPYAQTHGFTPHITLKYVYPDESITLRPPTSDIVFDKLYLAWGDQDTEVLLTGSPAEAAPPPEQTAETPEDETAVESDSTLAEKAREKVASWLAQWRKPEQLEAGFKTLGDHWWIATFTNNFKDRQEEILSEKAHDRYIARLDAGIVPMPVLRHWHIPGSDHGKAQWIARAGHMVIAIGRFDDTPIGRAAEKGYQRNRGKYKVSHRFLYPVWAEKAGVIEDYNAYEITTAPDGAEVNPYTRFTTFKEDAMPVPEERLKSLRQLLNNDEAYQAAIKTIEEVEAQGDKLAQLAVKFKTFADLTPAATPAPASLSPDLLLVVLEGQKTLADSFDFVEKALEGMKAHFDAKVAEMETAKQAFEAKSKQLDVVLAEKPRRIEAAEVAADEKAKEAVEQQGSGVEYDQRWPGMQVPVKGN